MSNPALEQLLQHPALFRAGRISDAANRTGIPTGYPRLDRQLPWSGWPPDKLIELIPGPGTSSELTLVMPALAASSQAGRAVVLTDPPHRPYAPGLAQHGVRLAQLVVVHAHTERDRLWTAEQCLRSGACGAVLVWERDTLEGRSLRRLQLAAEDGACPAFLFRHRLAARRPSPAALRLILTHRAKQLQVTVLKGQGAAGATFEFGPDTGV
ncbi:MAG: translesion DNA synthesis-associated protein ImuA [Gammaproteobacteria bacterium]